MDIAKQPVAHISKDHRQHGLEDHLYGTALRCASFASEFGSADWGNLIGMWHDLGKYSAEFQRYIVHVSGIDANIEGTAGRVDHSTAGSLYAVEHLGKLGRLLAYLIAGHHAGLPDWQSDESGRKSLVHRLQKSALLEVLRTISIPSSILEISLPNERPPKIATTFTQEFWLRMLYSCLVDADFLDTEAFMNAQKSSKREGYLSIADLLPLFDSYMSNKQAEAPDSNINQLRTKILKQCIDKASSPPGLYTLTVPTGGGKTLSSMAFALHHALQHNKRRIIYVIPYTSIIEQTADQFRKIFGDVVVEHHSNLAENDEEHETSQNRLASENWDAPIIVTTNVQFFESLFAARSSRCRKVHNIVNSVVILDEAQLLPPDFLAPALEILAELQQNYGVTVLLSTATQPALGPHHSSLFQFKGLTGMVEIIDDPVALSLALKRTQIILVENIERALPWEDMAQRLQQQESVLCIVNRRDDARILWEMMPKGTIHLSALMCGAHRTKVINDIKRRLMDGIPTRVISTQLVEAGVDIDFPVVYRALAGLDSIAQAAGRCNRENKQNIGEVYIFTPPSAIPVGYLRQAAEIGRRLITEYSDDPLAPERFTAFFQELYWMRGDRLDKEGIMKLLANDSECRFYFREAARKFHLIDDALQAPVIVRFDNEPLIALLEHGHPERWLLRKLQRSVVNLPRRLHNQLVTSGDILQVHDGIFMQGHGELYHQELGFCADKSKVYTADELIC